MKRLLLVGLLLAACVPAFAFDTTPHAQRIAVLRYANHLEGAREPFVADDVLRGITAELRHRGFDAYQSDATIDDVAERGEDADYLVEIRAAGDSSTDFGDIGIGAGHADIELSVVVARVAGELRVYDAETLRLLVHQPVNSRSTAIVPSSIGVGGRAFYAVVAVPFVRWAQYRSVTRTAARNAASVIATAVRAE